MYCRNCGKEINDCAVFCHHCGVPVSTDCGVQDTGDLGWSVLGFFIPIAGLILFLVWKDIKPKCAKAAGIGALVSVAAVFLIYVIPFTFMVFLLPFAAVAP